MIYKWFIEIDVSINNTSRQDVRNKLVENFIDFNFIKKAIQNKSENLTSRFLKSIGKCIWPILQFNTKIRALVKKRQTYFAILSNLYGFSSAMVRQQTDVWLTKLDLIIFSIEFIYKSLGNSILKRKNLFDYLEILKYNNLQHYKLDLVNRLCFLKYKNYTRFLEIITINNQIVQTLFVQIIEPSIDLHADINSFGFRKGRDFHQVTGLLTKFLHVQYSICLSYKKHLIYSKYIFNIGIKFFFNKVNCD